jgi:hypothetical protein
MEKRLASLTLLFYYNKSENKKPPKRVDFLFPLTDTQGLPVMDSTLSSFTEKN